MEISKSDDSQLLDKDTTPFIERGDCSDEIVLKFDDGKELYVSQNFLGYASPVFKAMFQKGFKEIEGRKVSLKGKDFDDMLELLKCIHPALLKPVDRSNVLRIWAMTDEFQALVIKEKCEKVLNDWLAEVKNGVQSNSRTSSAGQYKQSEVCLRILSVAMTLNQDDLIKTVLEILSICRFKAITGLHFTTQNESSGGDPVKPRENCEKLFADLPDTMKVSILSERLQKCDSC